jgi:DNA-directed RNA polymerase subunit RPC12/RpoP
MSAVVNMLKEYSQEVKYSCGHKSTTVTLDYKPQIDRRLACPGCYRRYLLGEITLPPKIVDLHREQNHRILMFWLSQDKGDI